MLRKTTLFLLLTLCTSVPSNAQGFAVQGTAIKATTPSGSLGVGGAILQPIPSAVVSVCPGSTLPTVGTICNPVTASLFSNIGLTTSITNPTNADTLGNYVFFVTATQSYVVSVSGIGVTPYSYIVTAPVVTAAGAGANLALSNLSSVSINTSLLAQTGVDLGSTTNPFRNSFLYGSGTYGTTYFEDTGTPTGTRVQTKQDVTDTYVYRATSDTLTNKNFSISANTLNNSVNTIGHYPRNNGTSYVDSVLLATDLPATTSNCVGQNFAQGLNAGGTPICASSSGASVAPQVSVATNYGTALGTQTIIASVPTSGSIFITIEPIQSLLGTSCGVGTLSVSPTLAWTAPGGTSETLAANVASAGNANGTLDFHSGTLFPSTQTADGSGFVIVAKVGTAVTYTTTSVNSQAGCVTVPQYTVYAKAIY